MVVVTAKYVPHFEVAIVSCHFFYFSRIMHNKKFDYCVKPHIVNK